MTADASVFGAGRTEQQPGRLRSPILLVFLLSSFLPFHRWHFIKKHLRRKTYGKLFRINN